MITNNLKKQIDARILEFMAAKGLSRNKMAKIIGSHTTTIYDIEKGKTSAGSITHERILRAFPDLSREWLFSGTGPMLITQHINLPSPNQTQLIHRLEAEIQRLTNENEQLRNDLAESKNNLAITQQNLKMMVEFVHGKGGSDAGENKTSGGGKVGRAV
jgi:transcriptional regulator with XRE-family HTH domain